MAIKDISMMTPVEIAFEYDGDKKAIGRAVQNGLISPDIGMMAGMFVDRTIMSNMKPPATTAFEDVMGADQMGQMGQMAMAPDMAPAGMGGGVADLPVPEEMMPGYAGGGIVAFAGPEGSLVEEEEKDPLIKDLEKYYEFRKARREQLPDTQREAMRTYYGGASERAQKQAERDKYMTLLEFASALGSSKSPRFTQALAEASGRVAPSMREAEKSRRAMEEASMKGLFDIESAERAEMLKDFEGAEGLAARKIASEKDLRADRFVKRFVAAARLDPKLKGIPQEQLEIMAEREFLNLQGMAGPRAQTQAYGASVTAADYARKVREDNKRDYSLAQREITRDTSPELAKRIRDAQANVQRLEAEINRVTGFMGGGQSAPAGGGGGTSGWGELRVR